MVGRKAVDEEQARYRMVVQERRPPFIVVARLLVA